MELPTMLVVIRATGNLARINTADFRGDLYALPDQPDAKEAAEQPTAEPEGQQASPEPDQEPESPKKAAKKNGRR